MLPPILTYQHAGLHVEIRYDEDASDPREDNANLGTIIGWQQRNLRLGDRQVSLDCTSPAEIITQLEEDGARLVLPVYYTSHGPRCKLELGENADDDSLARSSGVVYVDGHVLKDAYGVKRITPSVRRRATEGLRAEIAEYGAYLTGDVFAFTIRDLEQHPLESGSGFYDREDCETDANTAAEDCADRQAAEAREAHEMACRDISTVAA
jgi:hypothetical protein